MSAFRHYLILTELNRSGNTLRAGRKEQNKENKPDMEQIAVRRFDRRRERKDVRSVIETWMVGEGDDK